MHTFFLVGLGGCCGAVLRYSLGRWILEHTAQARLPLGTLAVNILGCLVIGLLAGLDQRFACFATGLRVFLFTGLLGGFTTFSAFGLEAMLLLERGDAVAAGLYVLGSVGCGLACTWLGFKAISLLPV
ncbi:fluoride efflux transporter CrcB [Desulfovibrionales bacterium]